MVTSLVLVRVTVSTSISPTRSRESPSALIDPCSVQHNEAAEVGVYLPFDAVWVTVAVSVWRAVAVRTTATRPLFNVVVT